MDLSVREWTCINKACSATHDRDSAASKNIRAEGIRILRCAGMGGLQQTTINSGKQNIKPEKSPLSTHAAFQAAKERAPRQKADGAVVSAGGGSVRPSRGRKTKVRQHPAKLETTCDGEVAGSSS